MPATATARGTDAARRGTACSLIRVRGRQSGTAGSVTGRTVTLLSEEADGGGAPRGHAHGTGPSYPGTLRRKPRSTSASAAPAAGDGGLAAAPVPCAPT